MSKGGFANPASFSDDTVDLGDENAEVAVVEDIDIFSIDTGAELESAAPPPPTEPASTHKGRKNKRSRRASKSKPSAADAAGEDLNLHVEAGWSEDDKEDKERPAKRLAANIEGSSPVAAKKADSLLESFTIRAVVTRKDVDVIFGHGEDKKSGLENETATTITIVTGNDDPEIVVDR
ncbi:hypothetical protein GGF43_003251, partial [Coemansia sp. RSA 2618]